MERLWSRVDRTGSCWLWQGATINGYGVIQRGGRGQGLIKVHVAAWESVNGEKPPGLDIRHQCDVRLCCNPTHLSIGTRAENMQDAVSRGRTCRGEQRPGAKLTENDVRYIRAEVATGRSYASLARELGVGDVLVSGIARGMRWKHVT